MADNLVAIAWTERTPIMDSNQRTDWEAFVSFVNLETGAFRVVPVSMSDSNDFDVQIEKSADAGSGQSIIAKWSACRAEGCRAVSQKIRVIPP